MKSFEQRFPPSGYSNENPLRVYAVATSRGTLSPVACGGFPSAGAGSPPQWLQNPRIGIRV
ncbi:hypothetical protein QUB80_02870 [Chlorogloeopsis sp. ULAP01]|uniref:hypothetical protein n=1 Tax=Chlorogloeopsis sp. ULAP01 TaxID=3056483 RepID=UPI0025AB0EE5|nr:hypothetical protein [Chlorogloeopsis sp. ULAP01]MDM9379645.1 hypothetical protein [Chlorogloeopsis sp. ULAP01]